jgi:hypothetical protein
MPELPLKAIKMPLYPTYDSLPEAILAIESQVPFTTPNQVFIALMSYHNTLINQIERDQA